MADPDLRALLESWTIHLRAERKAEGTVRLYAIGVRAFLAWCARQARPATLDRATVAAFVAELLNDGKQAATARARQLALRRFAAWLTEEGELDADPLAGLKPPKLDSKVVPVLSAQQLRALLAACQGPALRDRRDEALVRLLTETGLRAGETVALRVEDVDLRAGTLHVRRGNGGKGRLVPFGPQTARALDRHLRLRRQHRLADTPALWLGDQGRGFGYDALHFTLGRRAEAAGIRGFHPHVLRHTAAHRWLAAGGSERAATEAKGLNLGDL